MKGPANSSPDTASVRQELDRILASSTFAGGARRGRLLKYLVEKALMGESVKEYGIGVDVFEKPPGYDPRVDPSVRVEIGRLRTKLKEYYSLTGNHSSIRIGIPKGSYVPVFDAPDDLESAPAATDERPRKRIPWRFMAAAALILVVTAVALTRYTETRTAINSVAVLPFVNLTGDPHNDYLADGVAEQFTDTLAQVPNLRVVARTSAFQFKGKAVDIREIGRRLNADTVIEGSLAGIDGKVRLTVQVNRSRDGYHIFSRAIEGGPHDLARLENQMAETVLSVVRPQSAVGRKATPDPEAYELFLKARAFRGDGTRSGADQAIAYLNQAIERDPHFADAYASLASVYSANAVSLSPHPIEYANQARAAAAKALELDPNSGRALSAVGLVDSMVFLDWKRGEQELRKSIALVPQDAGTHNHLGLVLVAKGRFSEAIPELKRAEDLDPLVAAPGVTLGLAYFMSRDFHQALLHFTNVRDLHPEVVVVHSYIGLAWEGQGEFDRAIQEYRMVEAKSPEAARPFLAHAWASSGKRAEALALLKAMEHPADGPPNAFDIAAVYAGLGDRESAFQWLDRAYEQRVIWFLRVHPLLDPLRQDPRFAALLKKCGLD